MIRYLNIESEVEDFHRIHRTIEEGIIFKGTNLWILVFAIVVASVGLNMNSTAVIIGAMLISPLMGPINGMGYSLATYNFPLFRQALKNFVFAVIASIIASTAYFAMSPVSTAHSELLARTSPTIYDVLIAFFGGLAGILAISSRLKGNVIPGVAIATALMPPLCTAGYGLATAQFYYFFGAFYLFTINTVFIAIASVLVSQVLKLPIITLVDSAQKNRVNRWITFVILVTIIPSIYFGYLLVQKERFAENAAKFIKTIGIVEGNFLLRSEVNADKREITLVYGGNSVTESHKSLIREKAAVFSLEKATLDIQQGFTFADFAGNKDEVVQLKAEIGRLNQLLADQKKQPDALSLTRTIGKQLLSELTTLYPEILSCSYSEAYNFNHPDSTGKMTALVILGVKPGNISTRERVTIEKWLEKRLNNAAIRVLVDERSK